MWKRPLKKEVNQDKTEPDQKLVRNQSQVLNSSRLIKKKDDTIDQKKENLEKLAQDNNFRKVLKIKKTLNNTNQIEDGQKDLLTKLQKNTLKVNLYLKTNFANDQQLLKFTVALSKIANQITFFTWIVEGRFTDDGQAKCIGDFISKLKNTFSLKLKINSTFFADTGANSLSKGLKKLTNLRVLKLQIVNNISIICKQITEVGIRQIYDSIKYLPNLELFDTFLFDGYVYLSKNNQIQNQEFPKLCQLTFGIHSDDQLEDVKYVLQHRSKVLTKLSFYLCKPEILNHFYQNTQEILQLIFDLPYLLELFPNDSRYNDSSKDEAVQIIYKTNQIIQQLTKTRSQLVRLIFLFDLFIKSEMVINPHQIILDLYY